ncbi:MAG TPA: DUF3619 family protein [Chromatiales bacterium]|nr:DUF3619 family protein [Chromatiales bacterium]
MNKEEIAKEADKERLVRARALLDERLEALDGETAARLRAARRRALGELAPRRRAWMAAGGLAAATASLLLVVMLWSGGERPVGSPDIFEDLELLSSTEDMEFIEDLDFYLWLDDEQQTG